MASPVNHLGGEDARRQRDSDDEQRRDASAALRTLLLWLWLVGGLGLGWRRRGRRRVHRRVSFGPGGNQARLQLAQERGVGRELLGEPRADPVTALGCPAPAVLP